MLYDTIVVGGGIIGATFHKRLTELGQEVLLIDANRPFAGTPPSGGHMKPSWFAGLKKSEYDPGLETLFDTWTRDVSEEDFLIGIGSMKITNTSIYRVDSDKVVAYSRRNSIHASVTSIPSTGNKNKASVVVEYLSGSHEGESEVLNARRIIVATGVWAQELFPEVVIQQKRGISFRFEAKITPFIRAWAPYKQIVAHQQTDNTVWVGDGTAILAKNWNVVIEKKCMKRCKDALINATGYDGINDPVKSIRGTRAYSDAKPYFYKEVRPNVWLVTGAAKLGTIVAGLATHRFIKEQL